MTPPKLRNLSSAQSENFEVRSVGGGNLAPPKVHIALIKGVTMALSCWAAKIPYKQICSLTSFEPNKVYLGPNRNNKGVAIIYCSGPKYPHFIRFPFTCTTGTMSCTT